MLMLQKQIQNSICRLSDYCKTLPEGFDPEKIQLNDLLQFISKDRAEEEIKQSYRNTPDQVLEIIAIGSFQLLRRDLNKLADTIESTNKGL